MTIADMTQEAKRLRTRKSPLRYRPRLIYLVNTIGGYCHPNRIGYTSGQTAWSDSSLWFQCHRDAKDHADKQPSWHKARVVKLNIAAFEETICKS